MVIMRSIVKPLSHVYIDIVGDPDGKTLNESIEKLSKAWTENPVIKEIM
jgi:hypothetical protein